MQWRRWVRRCGGVARRRRGAIAALGVDVELAHTSIRFGFGRFNTEEEVDYALKLIVEKVRQLRDMSPLYEMVKAGIDLKSVSWVEH